MPNRDSELAYFRIRLGQQFAEQIKAGQAIPLEAIVREVEQNPFALSDTERQNAVRELESNFTTSQKRGATVLSDYHPWLRERQGEIDFYYWNRLKRYYLEGNVLPPQVVATLDAVTDEVLDYSGNPSDSGAWARRGMVMGHVQSGKTTNYSSLICKAADAGYKVIILLAGITNSLRAQTQERLDDTFIGKKSVFYATASSELPILMYATSKRFPAYGTTRDSDFNKGASGFYFSLTAHTEPIIFVTKKNKTTLERLRDWIREQGGGQKLDHPLLLIDDEADNASINTESDPSKVTAINRVIRETLNIFERSSYVGYTATPFANIFIDPSNDKSMLEDDLFPRHFIKALDPPTNYVGANRVFDPKGDLRNVMVKIIKDHPGVLDLKHKRDHPVQALPPSLYEAVRVFCLARAIRIDRDQAKQHCSMMINVSRFNDVQEKVLGHVYGYLTQLKNSIGVNAGMDAKRVTDPNILELKSSFECEFSGTGISFDRVLRKLPEAVSSIIPKTVNMKGGSLEYSRHKSTGLHVIAIGGLALSRGLTLEGLTVSYILRNTAASDTLMQMARWFGYRPGFEDICRLYLPQSSLDHYEYINEAIEELRSEIKRMQLLRLTPQQFGLRVRQSPTAIRITAANKMRAASVLTVAQDYSGRHIEGYSLINDQVINESNLAAVSALALKLGSPSADVGGGRADLIWTHVKAIDVMSLIEKFRFSDAHPDLGAIMGGRSLFVDYVSDRLSADLSEWDVAIPCLAREDGTYPIAGKILKLRIRKSGDLDNQGKNYRVTGNKNRVADPNDAKELCLTEDQIKAAEIERSRDGGFQGERAYCIQRVRPLLVIHIFENQGQAGLLLKDPIASLSFCLPMTKVAPIERTYQVNVVYKNQVLSFGTEADDDEAMLESAQNA